MTDSNSISKLDGIKGEVDHIEDPHADIDAESTNSHKLNLDLEHSSSDENILPDVAEFEEIGILDRRMFPLLCICAVVYCCSTMNGYDGSLMSSIYTNENYLRYFGTDVDSSTSTGLVFSIYNIGQICGAFFASFMDWKGRRLSIFIGSLGTCVGAIITATAKNQGTLIGGRFIMSAFTTMASAAAPAYITEISPTHLKGKIAGCYNTLWYLGAIIASLSAYGSSLHQTGNAVFKIPLWLQMLFPGIVVIFGLFIPESPRWLVGVGRNEDARKIITKFHCGGDDNNSLIDLEIAQMVESFHDAHLDNPLSVLDFRPLLRTKANRYRLFLVVAFSWYGQFSGNNVCSYYLPTMLNNVGMTTETTNVLMNAVYSIVSWVSSIIGSLVHDKVGRRKMFMISSLGSAIALSGLAICTARYQATKVQGAATGTLVFIYLFGVIFSFAFTPMQPIYGAEISLNLFRSRLIVISNITSGLAQFVNQFASPKAMKNIKYWFYVFYVFWDIQEFIVFYFFFVETRNKSLEELDKIFEAKNPRKVSVGNYEDEDDGQFDLEKEKDNTIKSLTHQFAKERAAQNQNEEAQL